MSTPRVLPIQTKEQCLQDEIEFSAKLLGGSAGALVLGNILYYYFPESFLAKTSLFAFAIPASMYAGTLLTMSLLAKDIESKQTLREKEETIKKAQIVGYTALTAGAIGGGLSVAYKSSIYGGKWAANGLFTVSPALISIGIGCVLAANDKTWCDCDSVSAGKRIDCSQFVPVA